MNTRFDPELARLDFEDRLVQLCEDPGMPLLERARLLGIAAGRIDVFFMTRVGRLKRLIGNRDGTASELTAMAEQLEAVAVEAHRLTGRIYRLLTRDLLPALEKEGIRIERLDAIGDADRDWLHTVHREKFLAAIAPRLVADGDAFPHVRNLRPTLIAEARSDASAAGLFLVELPTEVPRLIRLRDEHRFVPREQLLAAELSLPSHDGHVGDVHVGNVRAADVHVFRVTRNASATFDDEYDVLNAVEVEAVGRPFQEVVRLETDDDMPMPLRERLLREFQREADLPATTLRDHDVYTATHLLDLSALEELAALDIPRLKYEPLAVRRTTMSVRSGHRDEPIETLLHLPFDDYVTSLQQFLRDAAEHPELESMQTTIYRTDTDSGVVSALRVARERGADVSAVVELKASFDERDNVELARSLAEAGVRVVISPPSLKVHAKIALVTFRAPDNRTPRRVALIGTGNMNAVTARSYIDLWVATTRPECTHDLAAVFDLLTGRSEHKEFGCLLVAPFNLRQRFLDFIETEAVNAAAGKSAGIRAMMNGLTDPAMIAALNRASQAGVPIDLAVRGISLLRPGVPGISENIRVVSVAGRLLQHARIFHFTNAGDDRYMIGSADWRPRNCDHRVEVVAPLRSQENISRLDRVLAEVLCDPNGWVLGSDGVYARQPLLEERPSLHVKPVHLAARIRKAQ